MIRKIGLFLVLSTSLLTTNAFSITTQAFRVGPAVEYVLAINEPQVISNVFLWTVKAECKATSTNESNLLSFKVIRKSGSFNGTKLSVGDSMEVLIHNNDKLFITANPGAQVQLVNHGQKTMFVSCSVG